MSGITHLYDLYNKKGKEFVDKLLNSYVTVNEKMDGSAFIFERDIDSGKFNFYKRDQRNPIKRVVILIRIPTLTLESDGTSE